MAAPLQPGAAASIEAIAAALRVPPAEVFARIERFDPSPHKRMLRVVVDGQRGRGIAVTDHEAKLLGWGGYEPDLAPVSPKPTAPRPAPRPGPSAETLRDEARAVGLARLTPEGRARLSVAAAARNAARAPSPEEIARREEARRAHDRERKREAARRCADESTAAAARTKRARRVAS